MSGQASTPSVSFEFFPPGSERMEQSLWSSIKRLSPLCPRFVSVTYGAGGSTRERTHNTIERILLETDLTPAAHLTCIDATRGQVDQVANEYWRMGVRHIVALRGDEPPNYRPGEDGYDYAVDLVKGLKRLGDFQISVAAYPETHPSALSPQADLDNLKQKIDAGADSAITQFFFDTDIFLRFAEKAAKAGIRIPLTPGILPVSNFAKVEAFSKKCGATIPKWMSHLFAGLDDDPRTRQLVAATIAAEQCRRLQKVGVENFHFYTLNRADLTFAICHILGLRAQLKANEVAEK